MSWRQPLIPWGWADESTKQTAVCTEVADRGCLCLGLWITKDGIQGQDEIAACSAKP